MHVQIGFDLNYVKHYASPERAQKEVEKALADMIAAGVCFNIVVVQQRKEGTDDPYGIRHIPLLTCWRVPKGCILSHTQAAINAARRGFVVFA